MCDLGWGGNGGRERFGFQKGKSLWIPVKIYHCKSGQLLKQASQKNGGIPGSVQNHVGEAPGTWVSAGPGTAGLRAGLTDLKGFFQPK